MQLERKARARAFARWVALNLGIPDFHRLPAALLYLRGSGFQDIGTIDFDSPVISARQSLRLSFEFAQQVSHSFEEAMRLSLMGGYTHAQLQPLQRMSDTVNGHVGVILCCLHYFMIPDEVREEFWRAQWSDTDSDTDIDSDTDSDSDSD